MNHDDGPDARDNVNPSDPEDLRYWMDKLGCSASVLRDAVMICGPDANAVRVFVAGAREGRRHEAAAIRARELAAAAIARSRKPSQG